MNPLHVSELNTYLECPRKWEHAYRDRRVPRQKAVALDDGTAVDVWLNAWWEVRPGPLPIPAKPSLKALCIGYDAFYQNVTPLSHVHSQVHWTAPVGGVMCAGTLDGIGFDTHGDEVIRESKTTSHDISPGSLYWRERNHCDPQITMYSAAFPGARVLYDVLHKPDIEQKLATPEDKRKYTKATKKEPSRLYAGMRETDESEEEYISRILEDISERPEKYYQRAMMVRLEEEHRKFALDVQIVDERRRLKMQPRNSKACMYYGKPCPYFEVCWEGGSLDNDLRFMDQEEGR